MKLQISYSPAKVVVVVMVVMMVVVVVVVVVMVVVAVVLLLLLPLPLLPPLPLKIMGEVEAPLEDMTLGYMVSNLLLSGQQKLLDELQLVVGLLFCWLQRWD